MVSARLDAGTRWVCGCAAGPPLESSGELGKVNATVLLLDA